MEERFETFTVLINRISRNIRKIKNQEMADCGLRSSQVSCLYYLYLANGMTATELCERCEEDKATVSRSLDYLEESGYLLPRVQGAKRYKSPLLLTEKGAEVGRTISNRIDWVLGEVGRSLTEQERTDFYRSLSVISRSLELVAERKGENR